MKRRRTEQIKIGNVKIGGNAPISVQSMTKTDTRHINKTVAQIVRLQNAGCEIIRVAVKDSISARAVKKIKPRICIPLVADIHFDYKLALESIAAGCDAIRLNPGNIKRKEHIREVIKACRTNKIPIRIGLNSGSAGTHTAGGLCRIAHNYVKFFEKQGFYDIIVSLKASDVLTTIEAYRKMAGACEYPFHLGITAAGSSGMGTVKSAVGIGTLLAEGIGDTIRVSLTEKPEQEVLLAKQILQSLGLRTFYHDIISCPTCGRCQVDLVKIVGEFKNKLSTIHYPLSTKQVKIALMGCEVNGPGEAKDADIGVAFGKRTGVIFKKGRAIKRIKAEDSAKELIDCILRLH